MEQGFSIPDKNYTLTDIDSSTFWEFLQKYLPNWEKDADYDNGSLLNEILMDESDYTDEEIIERFGTLDETKLKAIYKEEIIILLHKINELQICTNKSED